jgi:hypothetical protein
MPANGVSRQLERIHLAAYVGNVIAGILEGIRLHLGGDPLQVPSTFHELTANGTWSTHSNSGDTLMLVDLTIAPAFHGVGLFEAFGTVRQKNFRIALRRRSHVQSPIPH